MKKQSTSFSKMFNFRIILISFFVALFCIPNATGQQQLVVKPNDTTSQNIMVEPPNSNSFYGQQAGRVTLGGQNTFIGSESGLKNSSGNENVFLGSGAGLFNTVGIRNVYVGRFAGERTLGDYNLFLGYGAGEFSTGSRNLFIGSTAGIYETGNNKLYIEHSTAANAGSPPLIYGDFAIDYLRANASMEVLSDSTSMPSIRAIKNYSSETYSDIPAVYGENTVDDYYGIGVDGKGGYIGVRGIVEGTESGAYFGLSGGATGTNSGTNYGVYGYAYGGSRNWAGYFAGNSYVQDSVGIGTTSPLTRFSISPSILEPKITLYDAGSLVNHGGFGYTSFQMNYHVLPNDNHVFYAGGKNGDGTELMRIQSSGRVGIGTADPVEKLHIRSGDDPTILLQSDGTDEPSGRVSLRQSNSTGFDIFYDGAPDKLVFEGFAGTTSQGQHMTIDYNTGNVGIGTSADAAQNLASGFKLSVNGKIASEEILVDLSNSWPDYVFKKDYQLKTLSEVERFIEDQGHLPGLPAAADVQDAGILLGEMNRVLVEKIEELTLYILAQEKRINKLEEQVNKSK